MNPADSGRDSTGRPRSVEDVEEINRLRAENRNVGIAFIAALATHKADCDKLAEILCRRDRLRAALTDLVESLPVRLFAPRRAAWALTELQADALPITVLADRTHRAAPPVALDPPPPAFAEAETEEGSVGRVHLEVDPTEGAPGE